MLRSMYAGISGMKNFQTKLDVIGNNIANVSTSGFKKGRVTFQDMMSQTTAGAQGPTANRGGVNASQVGLGSQLGSIDDIHTQGFRQTTNRTLDFALQGDGMFVVAGGSFTLDGAVPGTGNVIEIEDSDVSYTRAGNFYLDSTGAIVSPGGLYLVGFEVESQAIVATDGDDGDDSADPVVPPVLPENAKAATFKDGDNKTYSTIKIPETAQSFSIQADGVVNYVNANGEPRVAGKVAVANFSNAAGLQKEGSNLFRQTPNSGIPAYSIAQSNGVASIIEGSLEMSNVDLAEEFTEMIVAQRGFQANTRIISTSDEILQELVNLKR